MRSRDRVGNFFFIAAAFVAWLGVAQIVTTTYPKDNPTNTLAGAGFIGLACGLTSIPVLWLASFASHRRIALIGDWGRAMRRGAWVGGVVALFVALRIQGLLSLPIVVFVVALALLAEFAMSMER